MKIEEWKKLIAENKLKVLFADLEVYLSDNDLENIIILIKSDYKSLILRQIKGLISYQDFDVELNKIKNRILNFFSEFKNEITHNITSNENKENDILEVIKSINHAKSELNTDDTKEKLLRLQETFYGLGKVGSSIDVSDFGEKQRQELNVIFDKTIRRIKLSRTLIAEYYDKHTIFYKSYLNEMGKLISLLDVPKNSYDKTEINVLREVRESLDMSLRLIDKKKSNHSNRGGTINAINGLSSFFQRMNETELSDKLMVFKDEAEEFFDDIDNYNPFLIFKKDDLLPLYNEIKISVAEIENK